MTLPTVSPSALPGTLPRLLPAKLPTDGGVVRAASRHTVHRRASARRWAPWLLAACALAGGASHANDRPFQFARTAVLEDDEQVWSFESWIERRGSVRGLSVEPEYTFSGGRSVQVQLSRYLDRHGEQSGHEAEVELKQIFNHIGRDGYGVALSAAFGVERTREAGTVRGLEIKLPVSLALGDTGATLHLNPGWSRASGDSGRWTSAWALEYALPRRTTALLEWAHHGSARFAQVGARHWLRKDHLAVDLSWQRHSGAEGRASGLVLGLGWYDL